MTISHNVGLFASHPFALCVFIHVPLLEAGSIYRVLLPKLR